MVWNLFNWIGSRYGLIDYVCRDIAELPSMRRLGFCRMLNMFVVTGFTIFQTFPGAEVIWAPCRVRMLMERIFSGLVHSGSAFKTPVTPSGDSSDLVQHLLGLKILILLN